MNLLYTLPERGKRGRCGIRGGREGRKATRGWLVGWLVGRCWGCELSSQNTIAD